MKKSIFFLFAALCLSCSKEVVDTDTPKSTDDIVFYGVIDEESKVTVSGEGKVAWELGDEVTIVNGTRKAIYSVSQIGANRVATLTKKSGDVLLSTGNYVATYGTMQYAQPYNGSKLPITMESTTTAPSTTFYFKNTCGIVTISANATDISRIEAGGHTVTFSNPISLTKGTYYPIVVPEDTQVESVTFYKSNGKSCKMDLKPTYTIARSTVTPLLFTGTKFSTDSNYDYPVSSGEFTVNKSGKKVKFMMGNLYWNGSSYAVENAQYETRTSYDAYHVTHFYRYYKGSSEKPYSINTYNNNYAMQTTGSSNRECELSYAINGYRLLKSSEFDYLVGTTKVFNVINDITISGIQHKGALIYPDGVSKIADKSSTTWEFLSDKGIVFLPISGYRNGETFSFPDFCGYLMNGEYDGGGYASNSYYYNTNKSAGYVGISAASIVRLVKDVN